MTTQKMYQRKITKEELRQFCQQTFVHPFLAEKQFLYIIYGKLIVSEAISLQGAEKVKKFHSHRLAMKLSDMINGIGSYDLLRYNFTHYADLEEACSYFSSTREGKDGHESRSW
ncbi:hypothetical protein Q4O60_14485 [Aeribacillus pallidus]|nr:hypothetical protein [Aeribacillus pallidus]